MKTIAVCLMTCDRPEYTRRTLESFLAHNPDRSRFVLLHGDDASRESTNLQLARGAGFDTIVQSSVRVGNLAHRMALIAAAAKVAPWLLILENDIESVRPFPWDLFDFVARQKHVYTLRLFGKFKDAAGREACKVTHQWKGEQPIVWSDVPDAPERAQIADIHWSAQPSVTRAKSAIALHFKQKRELGLTMRVVANVMNHIGAQRTRPAEAAC